MLKYANRFAAFELEVALLSKLVIQEVVVESKGGRSVIEDDMQIRAQLRDIEHLRLPDCQNRDRGKKMCYFVIQGVKNMNQLETSAQDTVTDVHLKQMNDSSQA